MRNANTLVVGLGEVGSALSQVLRRTGRVLEHDLERCEFDEPIGVMHLCIPFTRQADFEATAVSKPWQCSMCKAALLRVAAPGIRKTANWQQAHRWRPSGCLFLTSCLGLPSPSATVLRRFRPGSGRLYWLE